MGLKNWLLQRSLISDFRPLRPAPVRLVAGSGRAFRAAVRAWERSVRHEG
jgi:hypothetical protein